MSQGVEGVIERIRGVYGRWRRDTPVQQMRADWEGLFRVPVQARVQCEQAGGVAVAWIRPEGVAMDRVIVYFHGGGFRLGSIMSHLELMARLARNTGIQVLGVNYRLAPEFGYPAPLEDALTVLDWLQKQGHVASQQALAGDSAGAGLALSAMLALHEQGRPLPQAAYLMSAWTDLAASGESYESRAQADPIHQRSMILAMAKGYLGSEGDPRHPWVSPLYAEAPALAALPPLLLQVGDRETVLSDSEVFAQRVNQAGGRAELQVWPHMVHVFQQFPTDLPEAVQAVEAGGRFLAQALPAPSTGANLP